MPWSGLLVRCKEKAALDALENVWAQHSARYAGFRLNRFQLVESNPRMAVFPAPPSLAFYANSFSGLCRAVVLGGAPCVKGVCLCHRVSSYTRCNSYVKHFVAVTVIACYNDAG